MDIHPRHPVTIGSALAIGPFESKEEAREYNLAFFKAAIVDFGFIELKDINKPEAREGEGRTVRELTGGFYASAVVASPKAAGRAIQVAFKLMDGEIETVEMREFEEAWVLNPKVLPAKELADDLKSHIKAHVLKIFDET